MTYLLVKSLHAWAVMVWVGGMLVQSLLVAAIRARPGVAPRDLGHLQALWAWDRRVTAPAMLLAWATGILIATHGGWFGAPWLSAKLVAVVALSGLHGVLAGRLRRHCAAASPGGLPSPAVSLPTVLVLVAAIVFLVIVKP